MRKVYEGDLKERRRASVAAYRARDPERSRAQWRAYKLRKTETAAGRPKPAACEVCGGVGQYADKPRICWDHCHRTGAFRGWLCDSCNHILGRAKDDPEVLRKLADYLERGIDGGLR